ncbi:MAG: type II toxin-antitoxin system mRNA interferase toxin, RelE/StbE family [Rheinheimera sp.]|uniref:type II toxin-antitoxin system RelE/ParE family toxin n=1 Tax=Arsukibacterium sp. UBA3155 TaxID=1946058 RepID=UPI000C8E0B8A|nr:type II toxin-antitoxin system RelE/ParE family toxin [Arsukibacterium sp. UBA3155]MAD74516.1 type II toxin-antitoxin system mRNA interferase toxin, RelE/StbE family [Rheinheimera sp.]|tara:strand:+ start:32692 stop:32967 length:276 start_codon:yes stop_codon:yes gene_type:complete
MRKLNWKPTAKADLFAILEFIAEDNINAAQQLKDLIETKTVALQTQPELYRSGRVEGTREMVVHPNYIVIYTASDTEVLILRVLHAAQQWP